MIADVLRGLVCASLASEITWMTQNSKWRVGYLGALMSLAAVHKEVSNSPAWDKFLEFIARCSTGFLRPADKFSGALLLTYDALICTFPDSRHVVESIDLIVHKALDGTTAEQSAAYIRLDRLPLHLREGQDVAAQTVLDGDRQVEVTEHPDVGQIRETISNSMMLLVHVVKWALPSPERTQMLAPYVYDLSLSLYPRLLACEQAQYAAAEYTHFPELIAELAVAIGLSPKRRTTLLAAMLGTLVERQEFEEGEELSFCSQSLSKIAEHINDPVALRVTLQIDGYNRAFICCFERIEVALMGAHLAERAVARAGPGEEGGEDDDRDDATNSAESQQEHDDEDTLARIGAETALAQLHNMEIVVNNIPNVIGMLRRNTESVSAQNVLLRKIREYGTSQNYPQSKVSILAQLNLAWVLARALSSDAELARDFVQLDATLAFNKINECLNDPTKATCEVMQNSFSLLNEIELSFMRQGDNLPQDPVKAIAEQGLKAVTEYLTSPLASAKPFVMATTNAVSFAVSLYVSRSLAEGDSVQLAENILALIARHLPCRGDATEAKAVYRRVATLLGDPAFEAHKVPTTLKTRIAMAILRSKNAEETKVVLREHALKTQADRAENGNGDGEDDGADDAAPKHRKKSRRET
jgi:hypothetical protein